MTSRYPLTLNDLSSTIEELPASIDLDLSGSNISNVGNIVAGNSMSANYFVGTLYGTANIANIANVAYSVTGANVSGTVANATYAANAGASFTSNSANTAGTVTTNAQPNITSVGNLTGITVTGTSTLGNIGNVKITGGSNTQVIQTDGAGNLSFATISGAGISNGTSNVNIASANGNVTVGVAGVANTVVFGNNQTTFNFPIRTSNSVIIGIDAGNPSVATSAGHIQIGNRAGNTTNTFGDSCIAIGWQAGTFRQSNGAIGIGISAGSMQNDGAIAIGYEAQKSAGSFANSIAIGVRAGFASQNPSTIAIGLGAGYSDQNTHSIAIGTNAANNTQGANAIAIGTFAGRTSQANNSIILNATGANLNQTTANTFTVKPVREINNLSSSVLDYNTTTGEISSHLRTFGSFSSNATQTSNGANTTNYMTLNNTEDANGISIASSTQLTVARVGRYNIQFSAQVEKTDAGTDFIEIWLDKNGTAVANSATQITLEGNNAKAVAAWDFNVNAANVNDYFRLAWASPDTDVQLTAIPTANTISGVAIPSVIVNINPIGA